MIATSKTCRKCGVEKDAQEFHADPRYRDGLGSYCKACKYVLSSKARDAWKLRHMDRHRLSMRDAQRRYRVDPANGIKRAARIAVRDAIYSGRMLRGSCEVCGKPNAHGHHDDYSKPLDVRWLCSTHHREHHKKET